MSEPVNVQVHHEVGGEGVAAKAIREAKEAAEAKAMAEAEAAARAKAAEAKAAEEPTHPAPKRSHH